ncbi:X-ray radiation resistance-associated protein 1 [Geodia barretti]|uniref:X-ray radiation resistance-associated protein 1 n=1 Tax=Geodia barretti TaxID=519541 RepID=A0AA35SBV7_GEOBA|nr:X-ray radiation resistance-associated protein 1 [Geodia barretti]
MAAHQNGLLLGPVAVNGFPARRFTKSTSYQGGEWVTAYQAEQRRHLRAVFLSQEQQGRHGSGSWGLLSPPLNTREASGATRRVLNREFLMRHCFVDAPSDLSHADISGVHQKSYRAEDFAAFDSLVLMNASDSALPMEAFKTFPVLEQLELCMCGVSDISIDHTDFTRLQCLDLSYNAVSGQAMLALGTLPRLRELHLTGNDIVALPVEMSRPFRINKDTSDTSGSVGMRFAALETLWLDDNKLTDQTTFSTLAGLRRLKYLNLDNNELYTVPQLRLIGTSQLRPDDDRGTSLNTARSSQTPTNGGRSAISGGQGASNRKPSRSREAPEQHRNGRNSGSELNLPVEEKMPAPEERIEGEWCADGGSSEMCEEGEGGGRRETAGLAETERPVSVSRLPPTMAPFPQLLTLSLANNLFFSSEGLLACGLWPALKELIIHGNPLISMCKGMPPRLQIELIQKKNLHIVRHKPKAKAFRIGQQAKEFKKIPPEPDIQTQLSLPPPPPPIHHLPLPPPPPLLTGHQSPPPTSHALTNTKSRSPATEDSNEDSVFITQGRSEEEEEFRKFLKGEASGRESSRGWEKRSKERETDHQGKQRLQKHASDELPQHYRGYEALLVKDSVPAPPIPTDLYGCIHGLRYALKHGSPYKPAAPATLRQLTHRQTNKQEQDMMSQETATHRKAREMYVALDEIRTSTNTLQANLGKLLVSECECKYMSSSLT